MVVGGYYREDKEFKFTLLTMPKGGHFSSGDQILLSNSFLSDYIANGALVCHKDDPKDCNTDAIMCSYMNKCSNNGVCGDNGKCICNDMFKSADCSEKAEQLETNYNVKFTTNGTQWIYF